MNRKAIKEVRKLGDDKILSNNYSKLSVKQIVEGEEKILLEITGDSETPVISNSDILICLKPNP